MTTTRESFWYLATPYSKYPGGLDKAFKMACRATAEFIRLGVRVYSPIAHTHPVAIYGDIDPYDHGIWLPADKPFMDVACGLIVYQAIGWDESRGILEEIKAFTEQGKPVTYATPGKAAKWLASEACTLSGGAPQ